MNESYAFWDLIAEEAYLPENQHLRTGIWDKFCQEEREKKIYLFGCNAACKAFIWQFRDAFRIAGILDNASSRWETEFEGIRVFCPDEILPGLSAKDSTVVIAMRRNGDSVAKQLEEAGISNFYSMGVLVSGMPGYADFVTQVEDWKKHRPLQDVIMLESTNDFDGNSGALYEYLRSVGSRYQFVWVIKSEESKERLLDANDIALCPGGSVRDLKEYLYYRAVSKWQIWDNLPIPKVRPDQTNVFLQHFGMGYKKIGSVYRAPDYVDYVLTVNELVYELEKDSLLYGPNTRVIFGELPRNDVLFSDQWKELSKIVTESYDKAVMWAPTLRESSQNNRSDSDREYPFGISVIYKEEEMERLNQFLRSRNMLLLVKLHPKQKCTYKKQMAVNPDFTHRDGGNADREYISIDQEHSNITQEYSNILYLDGEDVRKVHAYKLLTQMDAMISDYSSIVFDYMLLDRPIAWAVDDMDDYRIPFLVEDPFELMPGEKIYCLEELLEFLSHVSEGKDLFQQEREIVARRYNAPVEGKGCKRLTEMLGLLTNEE